MVTVSGMAISYTKMKGRGGDCAEVERWLSSSREEAERVMSYEEEVNEYSSPHDEQCPDSGVRDKATGAGLRLSIGIAAFHLGEDALDVETLAQHGHGEGKRIHVGLAHASAEFVAKNHDTGPALHAINEVHG